MRSSGFVSVEASDNFIVQFDHGKHFIGDGYRSLLLSDNSFNYPFTSPIKFWKISIHKSIL